MNSGTSTIFQQAINDISVDQSRKRRATIRAGAIGSTARLSFRVGLLFLRPAIVVLVQGLAGGSH